jgi:hypothetical protein
MSKMMMIKARCATPSPSPACDNISQLIPSDFRCEAVMSTGLTARMATTSMWIRMKKHRKPMIAQCERRRTEGIVGLTWGPVILIGMSARMAMMRMQMKMNQHRMPMMDQGRMLMPKGIGLESVKIRL